MTARVPRVAWLQLAATVVLFGLTWPAIKIGLAASIAGLAGRGARHAVGDRSLRPAGRPRPPAMAEPRRLADRAVGRRLAALLLLRLRQSRRAERAAGPLGRAGLHDHAVDGALSLLVGERVGWRGRPGVPARIAGIVALIDPPRFDWSDAPSSGPCLAAAGRLQLGARHPARAPSPLAPQPLDVLPWQMAVATVLLWILALFFEPAAISISASPGSLGRH